MYSEVVGNIHENPELLESLGYQLNKERNK